MIFERNRELKCKKITGTAEHKRGHADLDYIGCDRGINLCRISDLMLHEMRPYSAAKSSLLKSSIPSCSYSEKIIGRLAVSMVVMASLMAVTL